MIDENREQSIRRSAQILSICIGLLGVVFCLCGGLSLIITASSVGPANFPDELGPQIALSNFLGYASCALPLFLLAGVVWYLFGRSQYVSQRRGKLYAFLFWIVSIALCARSITSYFSLPAALFMAEQLDLDNIVTQ